VLDYIYIIFIFYIPILLFINQTGTSHLKIEQCVFSAVGTEFFACYIVLRQGSFKVYV